LLIPEVLTYEAGQTLLAEFKTKFPQWPNLNAIPNVVKHVYGENQ